MLGMIEIGFKRERKVMVVEMLGGKRRLVPKRNPDGMPETRTVANEVTRVTRNALNGHFCRDSGRKLVVRLRDGDILELRPQGTRHADTALLQDIYSWMQRSKADNARMARLRSRKVLLAERRAMDTLGFPLPRPFSVVVQPRT